MYCRPDPYGVPNNRNRTGDFIPAMAPATWNGVNAEVINFSADRSRGRHNGFNATMVDERHFPYGVDGLNMMDINPDDNRRRSRGPILGYNQRREDESIWDAFVRPNPHIVHQRPFLSRGSASNQPQRIVRTEHVHLSAINGRNETYSLEQFEDGVFHGVYVHNGSFPRPFPPNFRAEIFTPRNSQMQHESVSFRQHLRARHEQHRFRGHNRFHPANSRSTTRNARPHRSRPRYFSHSNSSDRQRGHSPRLSSNSHEEHVQIIREEVHSVNNEVDLTLGKETENVDFSDDEVEIINEITNNLPIRMDAPLLVLDAVADSPPSPAVNQVTSAASLFFTGGIAESVALPIEIQINTCTLTTAEKTNVGDRNGSQAPAFTFRVPSVEVSAVNHVSSISSDDDTMEKTQSNMTDVYANVGELTPRKGVVEDSPDSNENDLGKSIVPVEDCQFRVLDYQAISSRYLHCHVCQLQFSDASEFVKHVSSEIHQELLVSLERVHSTGIQWLRSQAKREELLRSVQREEDLCYFCEICDVHHIDAYVNHRLSATHKKLFSLVRPQCLVCMKKFSSILERDIHQLSAEHLKTKENKDRIETAQNGSAIVDGKLNNDGEVVNSNDKVDAPGCSNSEMNSKSKADLPVNQIEQVIGGNSLILTKNWNKNAPLQMPKVNSKGSSVLLRDVLQPPAAAKAPNFRNKKVAVGSHNGESGYPKIKKKISAGVKMLILMQGIHGSGKSYLARQLEGQNGSIVSIDDFLTDEQGRYDFSFNVRAVADDGCQKLAAKAMEDDKTPVIIDQCNLRHEDRQIYFNLAKKYKYAVHILEPDTPWKYDVDICGQKNVRGFTSDFIHECSKPFLKKKLKQISKGVKRRKAQVDDLRDDATKKRKLH